MKAITLIIFMLFITNISIEAQTASDLPIGNWSVKSIEIPNKKENTTKNKSTLEQSLIGTKIIINDNHSCSIASVKTNKDFDIKKGYWIFDPTGKKMLLCDYKNREEMSPLLMVFNVLKIEKNTFFVLTDEKEIELLRLKMVKL